MTYEEELEKAKERYRKSLLASGIGQASEQIGAAIAGVEKKLGQDLAGGRRFRKNEVELGVTVIGHVVIDVKKNVGEPSTKAFAHSPMVRAVHRDGNEVIPRKIGRRKKRRIADEGSEGSRNGVFVHRPGIDSMGPQDPGQGNL